MKLNYKMLIYDIETSYLKANIWRLGDQVVRHNQLDPIANMYTIYTISYKWYGSKKVTTLTGCSAVEQFDKEVKKADVVIGKNNLNFDNKYINTQRLMQGLTPLPEWAFTSEDVEKQLRKYFVFPSYSLDYISQLFGFGGKMKMDFSDWVDIANIELLKSYRQESKEQSFKFANIFCKVMFKQKALYIMQKGLTAWRKMIKYNKKDVLDTEKVIKKLLPYIQFKYNAAAKEEKGYACTTCGSTKIVPTKLAYVGKTKFQLFHCSEHNGYAGKATFKWTKQRHKVYGKLG